VSIPTDLIGTEVVLTWADEDSGEHQLHRWHNYRIIAVAMALRMLLLEGRSEGDARFTGPPIWVPVERIYMMEVEP